MYRLAGFLAVFLMYSCVGGEHTAEKVLISGKVNYPNSGYVFLELQTPDGYVRMDSAKLDMDLAFSLLVEKKAEDIYRINFFDKQQVSLVIGDDNLKISADGNNLFGFFSGVGSPEIQVVSQAHQLAKERKVRADLTTQKIRTAMNSHDSFALYQWNEQLQYINYDFDVGLKNIIKKEKGSLVGLLLCSEYLDIEVNLDFYDE